MEDRRIYTRISFKIQLKFMDLDSGKEGEAETVDVSANGVGFITKDGISARAPLDMWLEIPDHHEPLHAQGVVVWCENLEDGASQRVGVHLIKEDFIGLARALWIHQQQQKG